MAKEAKSKPGGSRAVIAISTLLALGAGGLVYYFQDQAAKSEKAVTEAKAQYREMSERMKRAVEDWVRNRPKGPEPKEDTSDLLTALDRKAREAQLPPGTFTITKNANATVGNWIEGSYTVTLQTEKKDATVKRSQVVEFVSRVEKERKSTKSKSIQLTFAGDDLKNAAITFS